jgi:hypothetical protein
MSALSKANLLISYADNIIGAILEATHRNFIDSVLGGLTSMTVINGSTGQTVNATPAKMTGWSADGASVGCTADSAVDKSLTVDVDGFYRIDINACFSGSANDTFYIAIYKNIGAGYVDAGMARIKRRLDSGDVGASHQHGTVALDATDKIAAFVWSSTGGTSFVPEECTLSLKRVG